MFQDHLELTLTGSNRVGKMTALKMWRPQSFLREKSINSAVVGKTKIDCSVVSIPIYRSTVNTKRDDVLLILYDVTNRDSFNIAIRLIKQKQSVILKQQAQYRRSHQRCCADHIDDLNCNNDMIFLIANKCDLPDRRITTKEGVDYAQKLGIDYFEISAKTGGGIPELFSEIVKKSKTRKPLWIVKHIGTTKSEWCSIM